VGAPRRDLPTGLDTAAPAPALAHP
jgi:hypothetical protein